MGKILAWLILGPVLFAVMKTVAPMPPVLTGVVYVGVLIALFVARFGVLWGFLGFAAGVGALLGYRFLVLTFPFEFAAMLMAAFVIGMFLLGARIVRADTRWLNSLPPDERRRVLRDRDDWRNDKRNPIRSHYWNVPPGSD